jgi:acetate kinase
LDVLAFTGGIGEHDVVLREQVAQALGYLGVSVDTAHNQSATGEQVCRIHTSDSSVEVWVVPTDEGRVAAQEAWAITRKTA